MSEWTLGFLVEDEEAEIRVTFIRKCFEADLHVQEVDLATALSEPGYQFLVVRFKEGLEQPASRTLQHFNLIHAAPPFIRLTRYQRLLEKEDIFDEV